MNGPSFADPPFACPPDDQWIGGIILDLPAPISVNKSRRIDWKSHKKMVNWTKVADQMVLAAKCRARNPIKLSKQKRFELHIVLSQHHTHMDIDNGLKWLIDYLRRIELIEDDGPDHLVRLTVEYGMAPQGCRVTVKPWGPESVNDVLRATAEKLEAEQ